MSFDLLNEYCKKQLEIIGGCVKMQQIKEKLLKLQTLYDDFKKEETKFKNTKKPIASRELAKTYQAYLDSFNELKIIDYVAFERWIEKEIAKLKSQIAQENGKSDKIITFASTDLFENVYFPTLIGKFLTPELATLLINQQKNVEAVYIINDYLDKFCGFLNLECLLPAAHLICEKGNKIYDVNYKDLDKFLK